MEPKLEGKTVVATGGPDSATLEVFAFATPNSVKVPIALEEMGVDYRLVPVDLRRGEQKTDAFRAMNPDAKVPVLVDRSAHADGDIVLSESAAILVYLSEKTGQLLPKDGPRRGKVFEALFPCIGVEPRIPAGVPGGDRRVAATGRESACAGRR